MIADDNNQQDEDTLITIPEAEETKILPLAAVYGGNAAGKTSFAQALYALQTMICEGKVKNYTPFRLDEDSRNQPSLFEIDFYVSNQLWRFSLGIFGNKVTTESLVCLSNDLTVYTRTDKGEVEFNADFFPGKSAQDINIANTIAGTTPQEHILLTAICLYQGVMADFARSAKQVFLWFYRVLKIRSFGYVTGINPDILEQQSVFEHLLREAGTGIEALSFQTLSPEQSETHTELALALVANSFQEGETRSIGDTIVKKENGELVARRCLTQHTLPSGKIETFRLSEESDGTGCFINLLPILSNPQKEPHVYIIDELDRSLHTQLSRRLIERHLDMVRSGIPQQLIFTSHDVLLMDARLIRKDELWLVDRCNDGASELTAFIEYNEAQKETDIRSSYLKGRMGGIPNIYL